MKKIVILISTLIFLSGCQFNKSTPEKSEVKSENISFETENLRKNYFSYVDTFKLVNMPPISGELKDYLIDQIKEDPTKIREAVEFKEKIYEKVKKTNCGNLPEKLCEYNTHIYAGSYFGLRLYEKANQQELLNNSIVAAPLTMWSLTWLNKSYENGLNVAKQCPEASNDCLNEKATNPIEKLVALCQASAKEHLNECIGLVLNKDENKNFAFMLGYVTGYNISFNIGNGAK